MIAYEVLCQAITDWKAGQRPSASHSAGVVPESYADVESYEVDPEEFEAAALDDEPLAEGGEETYEAEADVPESYEGDNAEAQHEEASDDSTPDVPVDDEDEYTIDDDDENNN